MILSNERYFTIKVDNISGNYPQNYFSGIETILIKQRSQVHYGREGGGGSKLYPFYIPYF